MESPDAYIPIDRRWAIAQGEMLPERTHGAALFADVSGFTQLTDALVRSLGPQRGAEELPHQLNQVYDSLIAEVDRYHGSVIGFSGDAITCWFDGDDGRRAVASSLAMQRAMQRFAAVPIPDGSTVTLSIKIAVATGPVRRFVVGDPAIQRVDVLAGATLEHLAAAEHVAGKGEVVLDPNASAALRDHLTVRTWRADDQADGRCAVVDQISIAVEPQPWPEPAALADEHVRPWLLQPVYDRLRSGHGEFLTELRPAVALFLRFSGIDYDSDAEAADRLDRFVRWVQRILVRYGGYLIQLTVGDKGSYLYAAWGAPIAHDDDALRAVAAASELRSLPPDLAYIQGVQIGISRGRMRTGAYGSATARTYGVLGPETNMAARLMQHAPSGEVFVSLGAQKETGQAFRWEALPPLRVKGKAEPATVFRLVSTQIHEAVQLQEPRYTLPMVGRGAELAIVAQKIGSVLEGQGQIVGITAEAGMGKSRLVAEVVRLAREHQLAGYGGECQSYGTNNSYLVWEGIWRAFFGLHERQSIAEQIDQISRELATIDPAFVTRIPLLGVALNLPIPDNDLTSSLDAKLRKSSLEALLVDCVRVRARQTPLLLVLEDCHWIDALSLDLLDVLARSISDLPVLIVLAYRPPEVDQTTLAATQLGYSTVINLHEFTAEEATQLIGLKLAQFGDDHTAVSHRIVERIMARAQGNPFYIDELLNYVRDRGLDPRDPTALEQLELPTSLHSLVLSRIDQLSENQQLTIKVASVIGRLFRESWLRGVHQQLGSPTQIKANLQALSRLDLTPLDQPEPEFTYLFKHIVTREAAYESLPFATRTRLHGNFAQFVETSYADTLGQYLDLLAYHYDLSEFAAKKREYLRKAGEAAQAVYANEAAIDYYRRVLPLLGGDHRDECEQRQQIHTRLGELLANTGQYDTALEHLDQALTLTHTLGDQTAEAQVCRWIAYVYEFRSEYARALEWIERGLAALHAQSDRQVAAQAELLAIAGLIATRQGDYAQAQVHCDQSIAVAEALGELTALAFAYNSRAIIAYSQGQSTSAITFFQKAYDVYAQTGNRHGQALSCNGIGNTYQNMGQWVEARRFLGHARDIFYQTGDVLHLAFANNNLGEIARNQGSVEDALAAYTEALRAMQQLGASVYVIGVLHMNLGATLIQQRDLTAAYEHLQMSETYFDQANTRDFLPELRRHFAEAALVAGDHATAYAHGQEALRLARELAMRGEEGSSLRTLGEIALGQGQLNAAERDLVASLAILDEVQYEYEAARTRFWLGGVYAALGQNDQSAGLIAQATAVFERLNTPAERTAIDGSGAL